MPRHSQQDGRSRMRFRQLFSWLFVLINLIKRCICRRKKSKDEDENVTLVNRVSVQRSSQNPEGEDLAPWDEWGQSDGGLISIKVEPSTPTSEQNKDETDLFGDMQPVFQKPKKILLKNRAPETNNSYQTSDRLKFNSSVPLPESELGTWTEDNDAWNEISDKEIEWETQNVLKEKRMAERERRALEQQKKKEERDAIRATKKTAGNLGIKIS